MNLNEKTKETIEKMLDRIENGGPELFAQAWKVKKFADVPSSKWSFFNQLIMVFGGTSDARGFDQWKKVGRHVKKGSKAIHIMAPVKVKKSYTKKKDDGTEESYDAMVLVGFKLIPVFRYEDTDGKAIEYSDLNAEQVYPDLIEVAKKFEVEVKFGSLSGAYGCYSPSRNIITMATDDDSVFLHELCHAVHHKIDNVKYKDRQDYNDGEVLADFSACVLGAIYGKKVSMENTIKYIKHYADDPYKAVLKVIGTAEKVIKTIMDTVEESKAKKAA